MRRTRSLSSISAQISIGQSQALMRDIRGLIGEMKDAERNLLISRENDLDSSVRGTYRMLLIGSFAGIISLGMANLAIFREIGKRRAAEEGLRKANVELENRVEARTKELALTNEELKTEIQNRARYEQDLRESEIFTRAILNSLSAHIAVIDKDGRIVAVNEAWENFAKQNCIEENIKRTGVGQNYLEICRKSALFEKGTKKVLKNLETILNGGKSGFYFEYPCHSPNEEKWFILQVNSLHSAQGGAVISHIDITDRKRAEKIVRESEERYRNLFDSIDQGFCVCEMIFDENDKPIDYRFLEVNPMFEKMTGISNSAALDGKTARQLVPNLEDRWVETYGRIALSGEPIRFVDGSEAMNRWFDVYGFRVGDEDSRKVALLFNNITERRKAEREREKLLESEQAARREAEIANRLRDEFLATVSHELRAPLNSILGWSRLIQQGKLDEKMIGKAIETIVRNAEAQNRLIEDLLDVSRIISGKLRLEVISVNPTVIVENALETVRPAADAKNIVLEIEEQAKVSHISGDPNRLQQVVWNLLSNAIKFTPNGGKVLVEICRDDSHVKIRVKDTGVGIKPEFLPHVFDRFRQADASSIRKFGGLGLGLAIVRHITEMHGGSVEVCSDGENKGSIFTVRLPLTPASIDSEEAGFKPRSSLLDAGARLRLDGLLVLVVDDEEDTRQLLVQSLTYHGATVITAASAAQGLKEFKDKNPDVLISDIGMPGEDGYSLIRKIRLLSDEIPAVALTAFTRPQDRVRSLSAGFQTHVSKPVEPDELVTVIASLTRRLQVNESQQEETGADLD